MPPPPETISQRRSAPSWLWFAAFAAVIAVTAEGGYVIGKRTVYARIAAEKPPPVRAQSEVRRICKVDSLAIGHVDYAKALADWAVPDTPPTSYSLSVPADRRFSPPLEKNVKGTGNLYAHYRDLKLQREFWEKMAQTSRHYAWLRTPEIQTVLDVGAGTAGFGEVAVSMGKQAVNLDIEMDMPYQHVVAERGLLGLECDARGTYPFVERAFDAVHCYNVFHWFSPAEIVMILAEWDRVLRPGGYALVWIHQINQNGEAAHLARIKAIRDAAAKLRWQLASSEEEHITYRGYPAQTDMFVYQKPLPAAATPP